MNLCELCTNYKTLQKIYKTEYGDERRIFTKCWTCPLRSLPFDINVEKLKDVFWHLKKDMTVGKKSKIK